MPNNTLSNLIQKSIEELLNTQIHIDYEYGSNYQNHLLKYDEIDIEFNVNYDYDSIIICQGDYHTPPEYKTTFSNTSISDIIIYHNDNPVDDDIYKCELINILQILNYKLIENETQNN